MQAVVQDAYGPADVLEVRDIARPSIADDELLVRVHAAGVDRGTWHLMAGLPYMTRLAGFGLRRPKTRVPGLDLAGVVERAGTAVSEFAAGDEVFGIGRGAFAQYAAASQAKLARKPQNVTFAQAAAVPVSGLTALQGLRDQAQVRPGQDVLIVGASGGVGTYAVQIAKAFGATVTGVCSTGKLDLVRSLGADEVIDYTWQDFADGTRHYDVILDIGGRASLSRLRRALTAEGTLVIVGGEGAGRWLGGVDRQLRALLLSPLLRQRLKAFISSENAADLRALAGYLADGSVVPAIDRHFPLAQAADAIRYVAAGMARGKVVVTV